MDYFANVLDGQFSPTTGDTFNAILVGSSGILKPASGATILVTGTLGSDIVSVQTGGTFTANSSTFHITTPTPSFLSGAAFYNLYIASTAAVPGDSNMISLSSSAQVTNLLTLASGQLRPFGTVNDVVVEAGAILKPNGSLTISGDLVSSGNLTSNATTDRYIFNSGTLQNFTSYTPATLPRITIGAGTVLNENGAADSTSTQITNNGTLRRTRTATVGTVTGGLTGATLDVVALGTLGTVVIDRIASVPNAGPGHDTTASWTFDVAGATGYSVGLTLPHSNATPGNAAVARYLGYGYQLAIRAVLLYGHDRHTQRHHVPLQRLGRGGLHADERPRLDDAQRLSHCGIRGGRKPSRDFGSRTLPPLDTPFPVPTQ